MKDIKLKATFTNSERIIEFEISDIISSMGSQGAGDYTLEEEVGEELSYLKYNWKNVILELVT